MLSASLNKTFPSFLPSISLRPFTSKGNKLTDLGQCVLSDSSMIQMIYNMNFLKRTYVIVFILSIHSQSVLIHLAFMKGSRFTYAIMSRLKLSGVISSLNYDNNYSSELVKGHVFNTFCLFVLVFVSLFVLSTFCFFAVG